MAIPPKDPDAVLPYLWDWSDWLANENDTLDTVTVTVTAPDGDTTPVTVDTFTNTSTTVTAWLSGGTADKKYRVTCHVVTDGGREDDRSTTVPVKER